MEQRTFVRILGLIKWVNLITVFLLLSNFFTNLGIDSLVALVFQLIIIEIISHFLNKAFEKRFDREDFIENSLGFKILNVIIVSIVAIFMLINEQYLYMGIIIGYVIFISFVFFIIRNSKSDSGRRQL